MSTSEDNKKDEPESENNSVSLIEGIHQLWKKERDKLPSDMSNEQKNAHIASAFENKLHEEKVAKNNKERHANEKRRIKYSRIKWTTLDSMAKSKLVKSSFIWLFLVPLAAKMLSKISDSEKVFHILGTTIEIQMTLPFSWELLFTAACCFTFANIIYIIFCPDLVKSYRQYDQFEAHGKGFMQVSKALQFAIWSNQEQTIPDKHRTTAEGYIKTYMNQALPPKDQEQDHVFLKQINNSPECENTADAFYFVHNYLNEVINVWSRWSSAFFYLAGLLCVGYIFYENIRFVLSASELLSMD